MSITQLNAEVRAESGKGAARRARAAGGVPAVIYGPGKPAVKIVCTPKEITKALMGPKKRNALLSINVKGQGSRTVILRELQFHPVKRNPIHLDFLEVNPETPIEMKIPLEVVGKSKAFADGAKLTLIQRHVTLLVKPGDAPEKVVFDVTNEGFGVIRAKQMVAPEGTKMAEHPETPLCSIKVPRGDKEEEAAAAAAAAAPAEGAAAAPGAAPAAGGAPAAGAKGAAPAAEAKGDKKK
jgi:large subunit ribosomal protein L25